MWCILVMFNLVVHTNADTPIVWINSVDVEINMTKSETYDAIGTYFFYENELAKVNCTSTKKGMMKLEVKDEPNLMEYINDTRIIMYMRMRTGTEEKYVDCCFKDSDHVSVVRIMLKPMKTNEDQNIWKVEINGEILPQRYNFIFYHFIRGDKLNVACITNGDSKKSGAFDVSVVTGKRRPFDVDCPRNTQNSTTIRFSYIFTEGLQDLPTRGLLYHYTDNSGRRIMHYEYGKEDLNMTWAVLAVAGKINEYHVVWKGTLMTSAVINTLKENRFILRIPTISPRYDDHRTTIQLGMKASDNKRSSTQDIVIVLRRKSNYIDHFEGIQEKINCSATDIYIAVGVGAIIIFIILLVVGSWWIRRELGARENESRKDSNNTLVKDDVIPTSAELYTYIDTDKCRLNCSKARSMDKNNDMDSAVASTQEQIYSYVE